MKAQEESKSMATLKHLDTSIDENLLRVKRPEQTDCKKSEAPSEPTTGALINRDSSLQAFQNMLPVQKNLNTINTDTDGGRLIERMYDAQYRGIGDSGVFSPNNGSG